MRNLVVNTEVFDLVLLWMKADKWNKLAENYRVHFILFLPVCVNQSDAKFTPLYIRTYLLPSQ